MSDINVTLQGRNGRFMHEVDQLISKINPRQTALLLGAGASIPSGAPSGAELARRLSVKLPDIGPSNTFTLSELCSLYEDYHGRNTLAKHVFDILDPLEPTAGIRLLPHFDWYRIYSTNFDQLVEKVYHATERELLVRRSNYDFSRPNPGGSLELFKIHGCITQDVGFGHNSRMLLSEYDYSHYDDFRQGSFRALSTDVLTKDVLIIGQSLADPHLKDMINDALEMKTKQGAIGRVFVLSYQRDENRARLHTMRGAEVYFGSLDETLSALLLELPEDEKRVDDESSFIPTLLPSELVAATVDVRHAISLKADPRAVFNGSPAKYADIAAGYTFRRSDHARISDGLRERPIAIILGAGGVGKTTLARQVAIDVGNGCDAVWEHNKSFPLSSSHWIEYEGRLRQQGKSAILVVDDCIEVLGQAVQIADHLGKTQDPALRLILTANTGKWKQRTKSRYIFSHGHAFTLSRLSSADINALLTLTSNERAIRELVDASFLNLPRGEQTRLLRERCSADMYVCMKNIFASEQLDYILLREFSDLDEASQDVYRTVSALEALGARVHRQLVVRLLGIDAGTLSGILTNLTGIVSEFDIRANDGLYGWETRHKVVASTIADYKFSKADELEALFYDLIAAINPGLRLEIETVRALCSEDYGIARLSDVGKQVDLLREVVGLLPAEQIPRHRLVRRLIDMDLLDEADVELRNAYDALRYTPVLARYEVMILMRKAEQTPGIMDEDRDAIFLNAATKASVIMQKHPDDLHSYRIAGEAGLKLAQRGLGTTVLESAIEGARKAESRILDPALRDVRQKLEGGFRRIV